MMTGFEVKKNLKKFQIFKQLIRRDNMFELKQLPEWQEVELDVLRFIALLFEI
jgi:hypothetical protein